MRKIKIVVMAIAMALTVCSCGPINANAEYYWQTDYFYMDYVTFDGDFKMYKDVETGVQYIVYKDDRFGSVSIVPRYKADGTLYVEGCEK